MVGASCLYEMFLHSKLVLSNWPQNSILAQKKPLTSTGHGTIAAEMLDKKMGGTK